MFAAGLVSCLEVIDQTILVSSVVVSTENRNLRVGATFDLTATVLPANASEKTIVWSSSAPTYVSVDAATGQIKALKMGSGTVTITATAGGKTDQCLVTVVPTPATSITLSGGAPAVWPVGADPFVLTATVSPADATDKTVNWVVSPAGYVSLVPSSDGTKVTVSPLKYSGSELIAIRATSKSDAGVWKEYTSTKVTFTAVSSISVAEDGVVPVQLNKGKTFKLKANVLPANASNTEVTWTSSDDNIATIDAAGQVTIAGAGDVFFTATVKNESPVRAASSNTYTAEPVPTTAIVVAEGNRAVAIGGKFTFHATLTPANSTDAVVWSTSAPTVASINATTGEASGVGNGTATITATSGGKTATAILTVGTGVNP